MLSLTVNTNNYSKLPNRKRKEEKGTIGRREIDRREGIKNKKALKRENSVIRQRAQKRGEGYRFFK